MSELTLVTADHLSIEALTRLLNQAYTDYYLAIWLTSHQFEQMCEEIDVDLTKSVVALIDETPVGLALLSLRGREGWISAVGVRPQWRRRGIARSIMERLQVTACNEHLERLRLEVLVQNEAGITLYEQLCFNRTRELLVLTLPAGKVSPMRIPPNVTSAQPDHLLAHYDRFHDIDPPWQRALPSLRHQLPQLQGLALREGGELVGYLLYQPQADIYAIADLAVSPTHSERFKVGYQLLRALQGLRTNAGGYVLNIPTQDPLLEAFTNIGYHVWHRQYEMDWHPCRPTECLT